MKYNNIIIALAVLLIGMYSCTDEWNDHYAEGSTAANGSLWQAISENESLTNFAKVLQATGYADKLSTSQVFTVFAPTNDDFTEAQADQVIQEYKTEKDSGVIDKKNTALVEFIGNHIALYNYSMSRSAADTTINMLNGKNVEITSTTFDGVPITSYNDLRSNGVLFTIKGQAPYNSSVFEYIKKDADLDSLETYMYKFYLEKFNASKSVPGQVKDGKTHYVDSVTDTENEIFRSKWLNADLSDEDSTYWYIAPTNAVWESLIEKYSSYYKYDKQVADRDSFMYMFPRAGIIKGTAFSKTKNQKIFATGTATATDSVMSTNAVAYSKRYSEYGSFNKKYYQYDDPYGSKGVFTGVTDVKCSNGILKKASTWNIPATSTFVREIVVEGESTKYLDSLNVSSSKNKSGDTKSADNSRKTVSIANPYYDQISEHQYLEISPSGASNWTKAVFDVPNVLSNIPYEVILVVAPAEAAESATDEERLPVIFKACLQCNDEAGYSYYMYRTKDDGTCNVASYPVYKDKTKPKTADNTNSIHSKVYVEMQSTQGEVSYVSMGKFIFPTCSYSTDEIQVKLLLASTTKSSQLKKTYNRILRLDRIIFRPIISE